MSEAKSKLKQLVTRTPIAVVIVIVFVLGYSFNGAVSRNIHPAHATSESEVTEHEEVWTCSMHP